MKRPSKQAQAIAVRIMAEKDGMDRPEGIPDLPPATQEQIAELGRWLVHEGSKAREISWGSVINYAVCILEIARGEVSAKEFRKSSNRNHPMVQISQGLYHKGSYWVGDPVMEDFMGNKNAIREWLVKVGMWRKWR